MWRRQAAAEATSSRRASALGLICLGALALAGCSAFGSSELEFNPAKLPTCKGPLIVVHLRWNFEAETKKPVRIYISSPGEVPKLWSITGPKGEANTGRWMHDGSTITVRSSKGRLLGIRTLETEATSCKRAGSKNT